MVSVSLNVLAYMAWSVISVHSCPYWRHITLKTYLFYTKDTAEVCWRDESVPSIHWTKPLTKGTGQTIIKIVKMSPGVNGYYRPRSALARAIVEKHRNDMQLEELDKNEWYQVDRNRLTPALLKKFVQLGPDEETKEFLSASIEKSSWVWTQLWYLIAKAILKRFWSITDINGWLGRGSMFVLSNAHAQALFRITDGQRASARSLVDVGAGDGEVSRRFATLYQKKYATEISASMRNVLINKGYTLLDIEEWWRVQQFDCVCMLNLLDRCSKPKTMLRQARAAVSPDGVLLLALVLPYKPYVEVNVDHKPEEKLPINGDNFEEQVTTFVHFMSTLGFELVSWTRVPYLCEGDFSQAYYWLDDSVFVFKPTPIQSDT